MKMNKIYRVSLDGIHDVKATYNYQDAKEHYLVWVKELMENKVGYTSVILSSDQEVLFEYRKGGKR